MKKILIISFLISLLFQLPLFAANFGSYKTETEYGIIDGFKWNFFNKEDKPFVELKSETKEEKERLERLKTHPEAPQDDIQLYRFMIDNVVAF